MTRDTEPRRPHDSHDWEWDMIPTTGRIGLKGWYQCKTCQRCGAAIIDVQAELECPKADHG
jgi:hypothetical protein